MAAALTPRHVVLTGPPGIGKTTLIRRACELLRKNGLKLQGFYTEELRERGRRTGFDVVTLDSERGALARVGSVSPVLVKDENIGGGRQYRVGQYLVRLQSFEQTALPCLRKSGSGASIFVIDEVGKMELFSQSFVNAVRDLMSEKSNNTVLTTIPVPKGKPMPFVEEIRSRQDVVLFQVNKENRDKLLDSIVQAVLEAHKLQSAR